MHLFLIQVVRIMAVIGKPTLAGSSCAWYPVMTPRLPAGAPFQPLPVQRVPRAGPVRDRRAGHPLASDARSPNWYGQRVFHSIPMLSSFILSSFTIEKLDFYFTFSSQVKAMRYFPDMLPKWLLLQLSLAQDPSLIAAPPAKQHGQIGW